MSAIRLLKKHTVFFIAFAVAVITCFFVPPDAEYLNYFDWNTLSCLFITLAVVCALRNIKFFTILARKLVLLTGNLRSLFLMLIIVTFIGSMLIANDMALITSFRLDILLFQHPRRKIMRHISLSCRIYPQIWEVCLHLSAIRRIYICIPILTFRRANFAP